MKILTIALTILVLAGCAGKTYYKSGATQQDFQRAKGECMAQAKSMSFDHSFEGAWAAMMVHYEPCMNGRGFYAR